MEHALVWRKFLLDSYISEVICQSITIGLLIKNAEDSQCALSNARRSHSTGDLRATMSSRRANSRGPDSSVRGLATGRVKASWRAEAGRPGARSPRRSPDAL